ncbi:hypothetical protein BDZ89DRAFT_895489, partial [Hymenopellis radicata]
YVRGSLSPKQIRENITNVNSPFRTKIVEYLELSHQGHFMNGPLNDVLQNNHVLSTTPNFKNPLIQTSSQLSINQINIDSAESAYSTCTLCNASDTWWKHFNDTVDFILGQVQIHHCRSNKGCLDNKWKKCRARFPRNIFLTTVISEDGHIDMKHLESNLNMITAVITYCMRCNTDVTSLKSGTAIGATIHYVSEYVVKPSLKTYVIFDAIRSV